MPDANTPASTSSERPESDSSEADPRAAEAAPAAAGPKHSRLVFRMSPIALLFVLFLVVCMTPVAAGPYRALLVLYVIPVALLIWIVRTRTVADPAGLTARTVLHSRRIAWDELRGLKLVKRTRTLAVLTDDTEVRLPEVRVRHLALLSDISGGRVPDPSAVAAEEPEAPANEPTPEPAAESTPEPGAESTPVAEPAPSESRAQSATAPAAEESGAESAQQESAQ